MMEDGRLQYLQDMHRPIKFSDELFFINPKVNIAEFKFREASTDSNQARAVQLYMVDGQVIKYGDELDNIM